jgi:methionyl aminopeptidase
MKMIDKISEQDLTKYNTCAKICGLVIKEIFSKIRSSEMLSVTSLCEYGDTRIKEECDKIYKRETVKGVAFATNISLNDCVGYYIYERDMDEYNTIKTGDVVKVELGVNIGGCIANLGETIIYTDNKNETTNENKKYLDLLNQLQTDVQKLLIPGNLNDDVKIIIESKCTQVGCFPVENTTSYQHLDGQLQTFESKYMITNYQKYYDDDGLAVLQNTCFEFEQGDVYTISLVIVPNDIQQNDETIHNYIEKHDPHIYRFNDQYYGLRLKMSRDFFSNAKSQHNTNAFNSLSYKQNYKYRVGIKECYENGILESYPILYTKDKYPVFHKKFTIIVGNNKCITLKYNV